jgi:hypothetical protein
VLLLLLGKVSLLPPGPPSRWADAWDPRALDYVEFVEEERGLRFKHPVIVNFVDEAGMAAALDAAVSEDAPVEEAPPAVPEGEIDPYLGWLRAIGAVEGDVDLEESAEDLVTDLALAFYDPSSKQVWVNMGDEGLDERSTLVHELTHALQDQHFELTRTFEDYRVKANLRFLAEGDARRIEQSYVNSHSDAEIEEYFGEVEEQSSELEERADPTPFLTATFFADYELGWAATRYLVAAGGQDALDDAFRSPTSNPLSQFDRARYELSGGADGVDPRAKPPVDGEPLFVDGLGPLGLYLLLAEHGAPERALSHAYAWNGDVAVIGRRDDGVTCAGGHIVMTSPEAAAALAADLGPWAAGVPKAARTVTSDGYTVTYRACDPGAVDQPPVGNSVDALVLPIHVAATTTLLVEEDVEAEAARCAALGAVTKLGMAGLNDLTADGEAFWAAVDAELDVCGDGI